MQSLSTYLPAITQGTVIRSLSTPDIPYFHAYRSDAKLALYQGWSPMDLAAAGDFIAEMSTISELRRGHWIQLGIADAMSNVLIGDVGIFLEANESAAEIGFTLCHAAQGFGHATRAVQTCLSLIFSTTQSEWVRAVTDARNLSSIRLLERANFVKSATQESVFKGEVCTELVYVYDRPLDLRRRS